MSYLAMVRDIILGVGWPVLVGGSIYIFIRGSGVYKMVKGSLIGNLTKTLVFSVLVEMYSLGIVSTALMFCNENSVYLVLPVFFVWFISFIATIRVLRQAKAEADKLTAGQK
ncbi:MAG: hypothetical protein NTV36_03645 [Candidatus Staskawiczbacteria bacterium]|nr:hypothetical protein [Candidatus Staskawiczbacteria bacterium]